MNNNYNGKPRMSNEEYAKIKAEKLAFQTKSVEVIEATCDFLEKKISDASVHKIAMRDLLAYLNGEKGYTADETRSVSRLNDIIIDIANGRMNKYISDDRMNIRVLYFHERMKTTFKKELHERIENMMKNYPALLKWVDTNGEGYKTVMEEKKNG